MAGSMSREDLAADLKASLHDAASVLNAPGGVDFERLLDAAAADMGRVRPLRLLGEITVQAEEPLYDAPADMAGRPILLWGKGEKLEPWSRTYLRQPELMVIGSGGQALQLLFRPAPTLAQIAKWGSAAEFTYPARHSIGTTAADTTIQPADRGLLLLRAQAEAMRELAMRNVTKPVQLRDGFSQAPRNGTPSALYQTLLEEFERRA